MTREDLEDIIYVSDYCPKDNCTPRTREQCLECCENALTEYENKLYKKALTDLWKTVTQKYDEGLSLEELDECIDECVQKGAKQ